MQRQSSYQSARQGNYRRHPYDGASRSKESWRWQGTTDHNSFRGNPGSNLGRQRRPDRRDGGVGQRSRARQTPSPRDSNCYYSSTTAMAQQGYCGDFSRQQYSHETQSQSVAGRVLPSDYFNERDQQKRGGRPAAPAQEHPSASERGENRWQYVSSNYPWPAPVPSHYDHVQSHNQTPPQMPWRLTNGLRAARDEYTFAKVRKTVEPGVLAARPNSTLQFERSLASKQYVHDTLTERPHKMNGSFRYESKTQPDRYRPPRVQNRSRIQHDSQEITGNPLLGTQNRAPPREIQGRSLRSHTQCRDFSSLLARAESDRSGRQPIRSLLPRPKPSPAYISRSNGPSIRLSCPHRLLIILDLNGTLLFRKNKGSNFIARPRLNEFLDYIFQFHDVMVWSSAQATNVQAMCKNVFSKPQHDSLIAIWARNTLRLPANIFHERVQVYKQLAWVWNDKELLSKRPANAPSWNQTNTILIDDSVEKSVADPYNSIVLESFEAKAEQMQTDVLGAVAMYLEKLRWQSNVSAYMRFGPFVNDSNAAPATADWQFLLDMDADAPKTQSAKHIRWVDREKRAHEGM